jgi:hypothetical protein
LWLGVEEEALPVRECALIHTEEASFEPQAVDEMLEAFSFAALHLPVAVPAVLAFSRGIERYHPKHPNGNAHCSCRAARSSAHSPGAVFAFVCALAALAR